jgi:hypothetical protein
VLFLCCKLELHIGKKALWPNILGQESGFLLARDLYCPPSG